VRIGLGASRLMWLFFKWSGVEIGDGESEETSVGDEVSESRDDKLEGSKSRSGIGGETSGLRVILRRIRRRTALPTH